MFYAFGGGDISTATLKERVKGDPVDPATKLSSAKVYYTGECVVPSGRCALCSRRHAIAVPDAECGG